MRLPLLLPVLLVAALSLGLALAIPSEARAGHPSETEPGMMRLGQDFLYKVRNMGDYNAGVRLGAFLGWNSAVYFREWNLSTEEISGHIGGFVQVEGFRFGGSALFDDPFDTGDFGKPPMWDLTLSYFVDVGANQVQFGITRNDFTNAGVGWSAFGLPGGAIVSHGNRGLDDPSQVDPDTIDEAFLKIQVWPDKLQGGESVNMMYWLAFRQRLSDTDGLLVDVGFTTISQNAWVLGHALSMGVSATWNHRYLTPYGRWSSWKAEIRLIRDVANEGNQAYIGRGPWWLEVAAYYVGAFADRVDEGFVFFVSLHADFNLS